MGITSPYLFDCGCRRVICRLAGKVWQDEVLFDVKCEKLRGRWGVWCMGYKAVEVSVHANTRIRKCNKECNFFFSFGGLEGHL